MRWFVIAAFTLSFGTPVASADSIEIQRHKKNAEEELARQIKSMNKRCGTTVPETGVIDWSSWKTIVDDKTKAEYSCKYVPYGITSLCGEDKIAQEAVARNVKKIVCMGDSTDDLRLELKGDTLIAHTLLGAKDTDKKTKKWLSKNLP